MSNSDMWISSYEDCGEQYEMGEIDRAGAEKWLKALGLDPQEIADSLDFINTDHLDTTEGAS